MVSPVYSPAHASSQATNPIGIYQQNEDATSLSAATDARYPDTQNLGSQNLGSHLAPVQTAVIYADDPIPGDHFGNAVAIDGDTAVIGARSKQLYSRDGALPYAGAAYVFIRKDGLWYEVARLTANDAGAYDAFGTSVGISGDTIVIGATGADFEKATDAGAVYVFRGGGDSWTQISRLEASDSTQDANFGSSVAIDGFTIIVGADGKYFASYPDVGGAYIFDSSGGKAWSQRAILQPFTILPGTYFGASVAVAGNTAIVGATEANVPGASRKGKAYIYNSAGNAWGMSAVLEATDGHQGDFFGQSVSVSGNTVVVGAGAADPDLGAGQIWNAGSAYVFVRGGGGWKQETQLVAEDAESFDRFGTSVSISGSTILVGAAGKTFFEQLNAGAAYIFALSAGNWVQQSRIQALNPSRNEEFGYAVSIQGDNASIGVPGGNPINISQAGETYAMRIGLSQLPDTGFAPGKITTLPRQPAASSYHDYSDLWLEIPRLDTQIPIVGVSAGDNGWNVRWLSDQAGYLEGTAFPTWAGNTGLVGHAVLPNGRPGPFAGLKNLRWGDQIIIHAWGQLHIYEVRQNRLVSPADMSVLSHEDLDWVTLVTCQDFDERHQAYRWRRAVRAVLINVEPED